MSDKEEIKYEYRSLRKLPLIAANLSPLCLFINTIPISDTWITDGKYDNILGEASITPKNVTTIINSLLSLGILALTVAQISVGFVLFEKRIILNTWLCIILNFLNSCLLASSLIYFSFNNSVQDKRSLSPEYYSAYISCILSFIICLVLIIDFFKNNRLRGKGCGMSKNQRVLTFMVIVIIHWTILGALVMRQFENWTFTRGVYFSLVTITTIGFGDYVPTTAYARGFNMFFSSIGIILFFMLIALIHSVILEYFEFIYFEKVSNISGIGLDKFYSQAIKNLSINTKSIEKIKVDEENKNDRKIEDQVKELKKSQVFQYIRRLPYSILILVFSWLLVAAFFSWSEEWDYFTAVYFCFISFTTIGYGDITVKSATGVIVFCICIFFGVITMGYFISFFTEIFSFFIQNKHDKTERKHKGKLNKTLNKRMSVFLPSIIDVEQDIELLKVLETNTENEEIDLLVKLVSMTESYHEEIIDLLKSSGIGSNIKSENQLNQIQIEKIEKYEIIYMQLTSIFKERLTSINSSKS